MEADPYRYLTTLATELQRFSKYAPIASTAASPSFKIPYQLLRVISENQSRLNFAEKPTHHDPITDIMFNSRAHGLLFNPSAIDSCLLAEPCLEDALKLASNKLPVDAVIRGPVTNEPLIIYTLKNRALAIRKNVGASSCYGLIDQISSGVLAKTIMVENFFHTLPQKLLGQRILNVALDDIDASFTPCRLATTAYPETFNRQLFSNPSNPYPHIGMSHEQIKAQVHSLSLFAPTVKL